MSDPLTRMKIVVNAAYDVENDPIKNREIIMDALRGCTIVHPSDFDIEDTGGLEMLIDTIYG